MEVVSILASVFGGGKRTPAEIYRRLVPPEPGEMKIEAVQKDHIQRARTARKLREARKKQRKAAEDGPTARS